MTNISARLDRDRNRLRFLWRRWRGDSAGRKHLLYARNDLLKQTGLSERVPTSPSHGTNRVTNRRMLASLSLTRSPHRNWHHGLELVHVSDVVDKRLRLAGVQKTDGWRVARRQDCGLRQPVETSGRLAQATVGEVGRFPIRRIVLAPLPPHAVLLVEHLVESLCARAFYPTQLVDGSTLRGRFSKSHVIHLAHHLEPGNRIEREARLVQKTIRPRATRLTRRIQPDASFANPDEEAAHPCCQSYRRVGNTRTRCKHQTRQPPNRNVRPHAGSIHEDDRTVENIEPPLLDE